MTVAVTEPPAELRIRRGLNHRVVFAVFASTLLLAFAGGIGIYYKYVAYGRVAARHLPDDTRLAARVDVETVLISESLRTHLLPLFDQGVSGPAGLKLRHDRFRAHTGVELGRDLREIVLGAAPGGWVIVIGGKFPRTGLVDGLETTLKEEDVRATLDHGVLQLPSGVGIGQATDGALVIASDVTRLEAALQGGEAYLKLGLPPEGAGGFALTVEPPAPPGLADFARISGAIELGKTVNADVAVRLRAGKTVDTSVIAADFAALGAAAPEVSQARRALEHAEILPRRPDETSVRLVFEPAEFDAGVGWLASLLRTQFAQSPPAP